MAVVTFVLISKKWLMSDPSKQDRDRWVRGETAPEGADDFARYADRGRQELGSESEAAELLAELDASIANRFGVAEDVGAAAGAKKVEKSGGGATVRRLRRLYAVAAAILLLVAAGFWWITNQQTTDNEALYAEAFSPYANELSDRTMGGSDGPSATADEQLEVASLAYDRRDYAAAATAFAAYLNNAPASAPESAKLYYGISLLGAGKAGEAIPLLQQLSANANYADAASWYLALAQLRDGQIIAARQGLEKLAAQKSSPFAKRAKDLLVAID